MRRQPKPQPDNPEQFKRFIDMACEVGADTNPDTLDRVLKKVARVPKGHLPQRQTRENVPPERSAASRKRQKG